MIEPSDAKYVDMFNLTERLQRFPKIANVPVVKKTTTDNLPETDTAQQTVICAVVSLRLLGLSIADIAEVTNATTDHINNILNRPAAQKTFENIYKNLIHVNGQITQGRIAAHANHAADVVIDIMESTSNKASVRLRAAQDILDRSGTGVQNTNDSKGDQQNDELRIVIMNQDGNNENLKIDVKK